MVTYPPLKWAGTLKVNDPPSMSHLVIAGLRGNAGAGGAMLALAADHVYSAPAVTFGRRSPVTRLGALGT
jgi:enoyl-CoA hydratase/carnithine racemase